MKQLCWGLIIGVLVLWQKTAHAQVFVKSSGHKAIPVRVQSLRADVEIVGAFAITNWQMNIQMEGVGEGGAWNSPGGICDFIVARPPDAKVTAFRVGQGEYALDGRVVERSVAAPRVAFRAAPDDPLLKSGLNANNSFRTTIYPCNSWSNVTLYGTWVQVLNPARGLFTYRLPLLSLKGATTRLSQLDAKITVHDSGARRFWNSFNLPNYPQGNTHVVTLGQKNYRVLHDLTLTIAPKTEPLQATLLVAPNAEKKGGHFALAMVADRDVQHPVFSGPGIRSEAAILGPKSVRAREIALFTGTYEGTSGPLSLRLTGDGSAHDLKLTPVENGAADALWATQRINALMANPAHRSQVIALSKTYSVASPLTSWLVVGDEDLQIYQRALVSAQLDPLVRDYWLHIGDGQEHSARAVRLRKAIAQISKANGLQIEDELYIRLGSVYGYVLFQHYADYGMRNTNPKKVKIEKRVARLTAIMTRYGNQLDTQTPREQRAGLYDLRTKIIAEYRQPHPDYAQLKQWELRFARLYGSTYMDPRLAFWRAQATAHELENQTAAAEKAGNLPKLAQLKESRIDNSGNARFITNIGDPPIYVSAPADAREVVALMPDGRIKTLDYNAVQKRWEGNYDIPVGMKDGNYHIQIVVVNADRSRHHYTMAFGVDTRPPSGRGEVQFASGSTSQSAQSLRLEVEHGGDVARVTALLPWGEKVALLPSTRDGRHFFAIASAPREYQGKAINVTYILIDRAHNITTIAAQSGAPQSP